ncbi:response regulator [Stakelama marina]|uniref:Response regulator n=1 Tax=Stakelama marina TaxID=2826939 RepID=A0A8T4IA93_9SPHN|nr:response regulator [Stakelama marina]MBR0551273.1 response regulator [Stakelama marina]
MANSVVATDRTTENRDAGRGKRILIVEDDDKVRRSMHLLLYARGYDVRSYSGVTSLLADKRNWSAAWLIADYRLGDGDGIGALRALKREGWPGTAILLTGHGSPALAAAALATGFAHILEKPLRWHELLAALV